jgi:adenosine kinase
VPRRFLRHVYGVLTVAYSNLFLSLPLARSLSFRVLQWILNKPNVAAYFGCVGQDKNAGILEKRARADGVDTCYQKNEEHLTGRCAVLITGKHRSLIAHLAAANFFSEDHVDKNFKYVENADFFYISGFFLTVSPPSIMRVAKTAKENDKMFMMNLSAPFISQFFKDPLMESLPYVDLLFGNESEALTFAKEQNFGTENLKEIGFKMVNLPKENKKRSRVVVLTQGHLPVLLFENDTVREFPVKELKECDMVDTNGAGDAFVGGFLSQLVQKKPYDDCIAVGIAAASEIIKRSGCSTEGAFEFA